MINKKNTKNYVKAWIKKDFMGDLLYLCVKTRTFWLASNEADIRKLLFWKSKTKSQIMSFQKIMQLPWQVLKSRYKFTKRAILIATHIKNSKCYSYKYGGWYMELKVQEFFVLDWIEPLFFNSLFQNNYLL